ncbi:MAG TPA: hypothetical protein VFE37_03785 [Chloroflexota bacterium]|nr:hypothetical protein [Chloroflexota bacterium]
MAGSPARGAGAGHGRARLARWLALAGALAVLLGASAAAARAQGGLELPWWRVANGGATALVSGSYTLSGTAGQFEAGAVASGNYTLRGGFWGVADATATPTPSRTPTPTATRTSTPAVGGSATPTPYPRPNVGVHVEPGNPQRLLVTITARDANCTPNNRLIAVRVTALQNGVVQLPGSVVLQQTPFDIPVPPNSSQLSFTVIRRSETPPNAAGPGTTVSLVVTDGCGDWPTFVGGGPNAF